MTTIALAITRTELSLSALTLSASPYAIGSPDQTFDAGTVAMLHQWAKSPYLDGAEPVGITRDIIEGCTLDVDVSGADAAAVKTSVTTLLAAFDQWTFNLALTLDAATYTWRCFRAMRSVSLVSDLNIYGQVCTVRLVFPRSPTPVAGPY